MDPVLIAQVALVLVVFHALLLSAAGMVWAERKVAARLQQRFGPTYTGFAGLLQPFADVFKLFFKEELRPCGRGQDPLLHRADHFRRRRVRGVLRRAVRTADGLLGAAAAARSPCTSPT